MDQTMPEGRIEVAQSDGHWVLRLQGVIRFTLSPALNQWLDRVLAEPGGGQLLIDLSRTQSIDSTNLGVLARIARFARERGDPAPLMIAPDPSISALLHGVCFDQLFTIVASADYSAAQLQALAPLDADQAAMLQLVLEAHRRLAAIDARNQAEFSPLIDALRQQAGDDD